METLIGLLSKHLQTFQELEGLQMSALHAVKNQILEGLPDLMTRQSDIMASIAREKAELRPFLDEWERLQPDVRQKMREGKAGEIQKELEKVAHSIQARHQEMFGADEVSGTSTGQTQAGVPPTGDTLGQNSDSESGGQPPDLTQTINSYRALL